MSLNKTMSTFKKVFMLVAVFTLLTNSVFAYANPVTYTGQGLTADGTGYNLDTELCGTANGAERNGPYLLWIMTATRANNANITGPWGTAEMTKFGNNGVFKYVSDYYPLQNLIGNVSGTYDGAARNVQLVISHGCRPFDTTGAWCSPGFWRNASDAAWALTGYTKFDLFNDRVVPSFYDTESGVNPTLNQVLTTPGANTFGAASNPYGLNAFNATGAFLTGQIPNYNFDLSLVGTENACPIDNHGNYKTPQP